MPNPTDTFLSGSNIDFIEGLYARWLEDPASVDPSWRELFSGTASTGRPITGSTDGQPRPTNGHAGANGSAAVARATNGNGAARAGGLPGRPGPAGHGR